MGGSTTNQFSIPGRRRRQLVQKAADDASRLRWEDDAEAFTQWKAQFFLNENPKWAT